MMKRSHTTRVVLLMLLALIAAACGNRLSTEEILAQNVIVDGSDPLAAEATGDPNADSTSIGVDGSGADVSSDEPGDSATPAESGAVEASTVGGQAESGPDPGPTADKAPIKIGLIGYLSGLGGATLNPGRDAWVAWQRSVNAKGGINGHPVELLIADTGGDEARSLTIAKDFVENKGVVALTSVDSALAYGDYARQQRVPIIGTITAGPDWSRNPFMFAPFGAEETVSHGVARLMKRTGAKKVASLYCAESSDCGKGSTRWADYAAKEGLEVVARVQYSVTQPDFTSECLRLQSAEAEAIYPSGDNSSLIRAAQSCSRQGYHPIWIIPSADDSMATSGLFEGSKAVTPAFPWFLESGSPAIDEYRDAIATYAPSRLDEGVSYQAWAWASAKLFEEAAQNVSATPTREDILNGLWSLKNETLGGLLPGKAARTFVRDQPTPETYCVFDTLIQDGKWTAPRGLDPICR